MVCRSLDEALAHVQKCRPDVRPNDGFMKQLKAFDELLQCVAAKDGSVCLKDGDGIAPPGFEEEMVETLESLVEELAACTCEP